jgi:hypothetical protein
VTAGLHAAALALEYDQSPPLVLAAKLEIFFVTRSLPQVGQDTSCTALMLRTNLSNG